MTSTTKDSTTAPDSAKAAAELSLPPDSLVTATAEHLVDHAKTTGVALTGEGALLTDLVRQVLQGALGAEMADRLGNEGTVGSFV